MAYAFGAVGTYAEGYSSTPLSVGYSSGITAGQLGIIAYHLRSSADSANIPAGFEVLSQFENRQIGFFGKVLDGTESGSIALSCTAGAGDRIEAQFARYTTGVTGWSLGAQIHATAGLYSAAEVGGTIPSLTISQNACLVLAIIGKGYDVTTFSAAPSTFTKRGELGNAALFSCSAWGGVVQTTATNIAAGTSFVQTGGVSADTHSSIVALLLPAGGAAGNGPRAAYQMMMMRNA